MIDSMDIPAEGGNHSWPGYPRVANVNAAVAILLSHDINSERNDLPCNCTWHIIFNYTAILWKWSCLFASNLTFLKKANISQRGLASFPSQWFWRRNKGFFDKQWEKVSNQTGFLTGCPPNTVDFDPCKYSWVSVSLVVRIEIQWIQR